MKKFLIKKGVVFCEGTRRWVMERRLTDGRFEFVSDQDEELRISEKELWGRHATSQWILDEDSFLETASIEVRILKRDITTFAEKDVQQAQMRLAFLNAVSRSGCRARSDTESAIAIIAEHLGVECVPTYRTFCDWRRRYMRNFDILDLIPKNETKGRTSKLTGVLLHLVEDVIDNVFLSNQKFSTVKVYDDVCQAIESHNRMSSGEKVETISKQSFYRYVANLDRYTVKLGREGRRAVEHKMRAVLGRVKTNRLNERWEIDHTRANVVCICEESGIAMVRPFITVIIDADTRMIMGFHLTACVPGVGEVGAAIQMAVLGKYAMLESVGLGDHDWPARGIPEELVMDNGMEFHSRAIRDGCCELGTILTYCPAHAPWMKARIERLMRTFADALLHQIPGATWSNPKERGNYDSEGLACFTIRELTKIIIRWIVEIYQHTPHKGLRGKTPYEIWKRREREHLIRMPTNPDQMQVAFSPTLEKPITLSGVRHDHISYNNVALQTLMRRLPRGEKVKVRLLHNTLDQVYVFDPKAREYINVPAINNDYPENVTRDMHKMIKERLKEENKPVNVANLRRARLALAKDIADLGKSKKLRDRTKAARLRGVSSREVTRAPKEVAARPTLRMRDAMSVQNEFASIPRFVVTHRQKRAS